MKDRVAAAKCHADPIEGRAISGNTIHGELETHPAQVSADAVPVRSRVSSDWNFENEMTAAGQRVAAAAAAAAETARTAAATKAVHSVARAKATRAYRLTYLKAAYAAEHVAVRYVQVRQQRSPCYVTVAAFPAAEQLIEPAKPLVVPASRH